MWPLEFWNVVTLRFLGRIIKTRPSANEARELIFLTQKDKY
jgi:hypothetical protein